MSSGNEILYIKGEKNTEVKRTKCDIGRYPDNGMQQFFHHEQD